MTKDQIKFSEAFERERARLQLDRHVIADQCGVSTRVVKRWGTGDAIPSVQQFKRLVGIMMRIAMSPPDWGYAGATPLDGRVAEFREDARDLVRGFRDAGIEPKRPAIQAFHLGLRRIREDNEVTQDELGTLLGLTGQAVAAWENAISVPVEENLAMLLSILPELQYGFDVGAIARPPSRDIPVPSGGAGMSRVVSNILAPSIPPESNEADVADQQPAAPETSNDAPAPVVGTSAVAALAEAHARARVQLARAKATEESLRLALIAAEESLRVATAQRTAAAQEVDETLQLLELAVQEEAGS